MATNTDMSSATHYWMSEEADSVASRLQGLHGQWSVWGSNPVAQAWIRHSIQYYGAVIDPSSWDSSLVMEGEQGELVKVSVPQARSLIRQLVALLTRQKLAFKAIARTTGREVVEKMRLGNSLAEHIVEKQRLDTKGELLTEQALVYGMSFLKATWRTDKGEFYSVNGDTQEILTNGDLAVENYSVFDVFYDYATEQFEDLDWVEVRTVKNKWSLIAQFPEHADGIRNLEPASNYRGFYSASYTTYAQDDAVYIYEVYHKPTPALPQGRMIVYGSQDVILYDGPNPYKCIPVVCMKPESIHGLGMGFGYPFLANLLPLQEMLDHSFSAVATNQSAFAVQNVVCPRGADISVEEIGGMNWINYTPNAQQGGGKPEPLQLTQSSPETFKFMDTALASMQQISNVNPALRGEPPPGVTSGAAIATLSTNAIEFLSSAARSYKEAMEDVVSLSINVYRTFAKAPRVINITGRNYQSMTKEFIGTDLDPIEKVTITQVNPLMQTLSGRADLAQSLMQGGLVTNLKEYIAILDGEPLQRLTDVEEAENDLVASENEDMQEGRQVLAAATDDHATHIREHNAILNNPEIRRSNPELIELVTLHIEEHFKLMKDTDPVLQAVLRTGKMPEGGFAPPPAPGGPQPPSAQGIPAENLAPMGSEPAPPAEPSQDLLQRGGATASPGGAGGIS